MASGRVELAHGAGGRAMAELIDGLFKRHLANAWLDRGEDSAVLASPGGGGGGRIAMTTDSYVISPLAFPGGDIGSLAVHGTINDLAMVGARPMALTAGFILEEGLALDELDRIVASMAAAASSAGVAVVSGDTKVVERGKGDGVFITTTGLGEIAPDVELGTGRIRVGDALVVSGTLGDHGIAVMSKRSGITFETEILSDSAPLHDLVATMLTHGPNLHALRDPTRGGLAATLNEIAAARGVAMEIEGERLAIREGVKGACELLGLDPLYVANEGKLVAFCAPDAVADLVATMRAHPLGRDAGVVGRVTAGPAGLVELETGFGGRRVVDWLAGDQLPRIC